MAKDTATINYHFGQNNDVNGYDVIVTASSSVIGHVIRKTEGWMAQPAEARRTPWGGYETRGEAADTLYEDWRSANPAEKIGDEPYPQKVRISRLFGSMPYGSICDFRYPNHDEEWTLDLLEHNLRSLNKTIQRVAAESDARDAQLARYDRLFGAMREMVQMIVGLD